MIPNTQKLQIEKPKTLNEKLDVKNNTFVYVILAVVVLGAFFLLKK